MDFLIAVIGLTLSIAFMRSSLDTLDNVFTFLPSFVGTAVFSLYIIVAPIGHLLTRGEMVKYVAFQESLLDARSGNNKGENYTVFLEIAKKNEWLASSQYFNRIFDSIYPDKIMELQPIKSSAESSNE